MGEGTRPSGARRSGCAALACAAVVALAITPALALDAPGGVGETRCGGAICHGAGQPAPGVRPEGWEPWKSARTKWLGPDDRHSEAYDTLRHAPAARIAGYMGLADATRSTKCLVCHAPGAVGGGDTAATAPRGVSCEDCHGPAEHWLAAHTRNDWAERRTEFGARGFYDTADLEQRVEKCASCHLAIDHEIVAAGHPALQFEPVAYAQDMRHWDDDTAPDGTRLDPTIWGLGQIVGLRATTRMLADRTGETDYQGLGRFTHFRERSCYQCHHKLIDDALRQAEGHYRMLDALLGAVGGDQRQALRAHWHALARAVPQSASAARQAARDLERWLAPLGNDLHAHPMDRTAARATLEQVTAPGSVPAVRRFSYRKAPASKVVAITGIASPWWWTTSTPEQTALAIAALCEPAFAGRCGTGPDAIGPDLEALVAAVDRFDYRPAEFARRLELIHRALFP